MKLVTFWTYLSQYTSRCLCLSRPPHTCAFGFFGLNFSSCALGIVVTLSISHIAVLCAVNKSVNYYALLLVLSLIYAHATHCRLFCCKSVVPVQISL